MLTIGYIVIIKKEGDKMMKLDITYIDRNGVKLTERCVNAQYFTYNITFNSLVIYEDYDSYISDEPSNYYCGIVKLHCVECEEE